MTVKFIIDDASADQVKITWVNLRALEGEDDPHRGAAGRMGQSSKAQENH